MLHLFFAAFFALSAKAVITSNQGLVTEHQGSYLARAAGCTSCHTANPDQQLAGGVHLTSLYGEFETPNLTPDPKTGIGSWTYPQFEHALRKGVSPSDQVYFPVFPFRAYAKLTNQDMHAIFSYLQELPAVQKENPPHIIQPPFDKTWLLAFWQNLFFADWGIQGKEKIKIGMDPLPFDPEQSTPWNRGAYLAEAVLHCAECHTPKNRVGELISSHWLAGSAMAFDYAPNITPDADTGLGSWQQSDWQRYFETGLTPDQRIPGAAMTEILGNIGGLTENDRSALITYLMSVKPVHQSPTDSGTTENLADPGTRIRVF